MNEPDDDPPDAVEFQPGVKYVPVGALKAVRDENKALKVQAQRAAEARTTAVAAEEQARVAREQAAARERADEELVEQIVAGFPQSVTAEIADRLGDLLAQDIETDLACSGAYSGVLDLAYGGKFWDLLERIQQITGRDLEAEARGQQ